LTSKKRGKGQVHTPTTKVAVPGQVRLVEADEQVLHTGIQAEHVDPSRKYPLAQLVQTTILVHDEQVERQLTQATGMIALFKN
jgi:hypothetical protein